MPRAFPIAVSTGPSDLNQESARPRAPIMSAAVGLLSGVRVLDLSGLEGMYGGRLLADLGADVVRIVRDDRHDVDGSARLETVHGTAVSSFETFANINKREVSIDVHEVHQLEALQELANASDVVLCDELPSGLTIPENVALVATSTFGLIGRGPALAGSDLIGLAAGGLLSLGGYPDTEPVAAYGNQALLCGGIMTGVAAVLALLGSDDLTPAPRADVSVQATLVGALEDATAEFNFLGSVRRRVGDQPREAGSGIFQSADGYIAMVAGKLGTAPAWLSLVAWLIEAGVQGAEEFAKPGWTTLEKRREPKSVQAFMTVFESYTVTKSSEWLHREGQNRSIAIAPVNTMREVLADPQLNFRDFFRRIDSDEFDRTLTIPGKPYRLYDLPNFDSWSFAREVSLESVQEEWATDVEPAVEARL